MLQLNQHRHNRGTAEMTSIGGVLHHPRNLACCNTSVLFLLYLSSVAAIIYPIQISDNYPVRCFRGILINALPTASDYPTAKVLPRVFQTTYDHISSYSLHPLFIVQHVWC